jgi:hypothetical protein
MATPPVTIAFERGIRPILQMILLFNSSHRFASGPSGSVAPAAPPLRPQALSGWHGPAACRRHPARARRWRGAPRARPGKACARMCSVGWRGGRWKRPFNFPILDHFLLDLLALREPMFKQWIRVLEDSTLGAESCPFYRCGVRASCSISTANHSAIAPPRSSRPKIAGRSRYACRFSCTPVLVQQSTSPPASSMRSFTPCQARSMMCRYEASSQPRRTARAIAWPIMHVTVNS